MSKTDEGTHDKAHPHLLKEAAKALSLSDEGRISYIAQDRWIPYDTANEVTQEVEGWLQRPRNRRPVCMLIAGRSDNGKTTLLDHILARHEPVIRNRGVNIQAPVLRLQTPPSGNGISCYEGICTLLKQPVVKRATEPDWRAGAVLALRGAETQVLMWDEINSLLSGSMSRRKEFLFALKYLSNELRLNIVVAGTPESLQLLRLSDQIESRFRPKPLLPWKLDKRFRQLLANFEEMLPLRKASNLSSLEIAKLIAENDLPTFGSISAFVNSAAELAIREGVEQITPKIIARCKLPSSRDRRRLQSRL
jgi:hypothetical protein